jgi:ABC-2 type transport system permease protein
MHLLAYFLVGGIAEVGLDADKVSLVVITGSLFGIWSLMLSHALETVTHAFYRARISISFSRPRRQRPSFSRCEWPP